MCGEHRQQWKKSLALLHPQICASPDCEVCKKAEPANGFGDAITRNKKNEGKEMKAGVEAGGAQE